MTLEPTLLASSGMGADVAQSRRPQAFSEGTGWMGCIWYMRYRMYQVYTVDGVRRGLRR